MPDSQPAKDNHTINPLQDASVLLTSGGQIIEKRQSPSLPDNNATQNTTGEIISPLGDASVFIPPSLLPGQLPNLTPAAGQTVAMAYQVAMTPPSPTAQAGSNHLANSKGTAENTAKTPPNNLTVPQVTAGTLPADSSKPNHLPGQPVMDIPYAPAIPVDPAAATSVALPPGDADVPDNLATTAISANAQFTDISPTPSVSTHHKSTASSVSSAAALAPKVLRGMTNAFSLNTVQVLHTDNLVKIYKKRTVVDHVSIEIRRGEVVGILGPNGAGKTTTFRMVVGLIQPDAGHIFLDQLDISHKPMYERARLGVGYLPQEPTIFARLTVEQNLQIILEHLPISRQEAKDRLETVLTEMRIEFLRKAKAGTLSGGERRRLEIARSLLNTPAFLMLDEPFAAVDPKVVESLQDLIVNLSKRNIGILITDHKPRETLSITSRTYIISKGKILRHGPSSELINDQEVRDLYLGERFISEGMLPTPSNQQNDLKKEVLQRIERYEYEEAIPILHEIIMANSKDLQAYFQRGFCFYRMHDYTSARLDFYRVWQMNPEFPNVKKMLLKCQEKLGIKGNIE